MMQWLGLSMTVPLLILTILAMGIPILIHLLSKSRGELIKIAHSQFLQRPKQQPVTHIHLRQRLLLLLRLTILGLLSLILADAFLLDSVNGKPPSAHTAVSENWLHKASESQRSDLANQLDDRPALLLTYPQRWLSPMQIRQWSRDDNVEVIQNLWMHIKHYAAQLSSSDTLTVYATDSGHEFVGSKPLISAKVEWHILPSQKDNTQPLSIQIGIQAAADSPYLPYWQQALTLLQEVARPKLLIEWSWLGPAEQSQPLSDGKSENLDWLIELPTTLSQPASQPDIARLNTAIQSAEFPLLLSQVLLQKLQLNMPVHAIRSQPSMPVHVNSSQLSMPVHVKLTPLQISETLPEDKALVEQSMANEWPSRTSLLAYLGMLLIILFCLERWCSEKYAVVGNGQMSGDGRE